MHSGSIRNSRTTPGMECWAFFIVNRQLLVAAISWLDFLPWPFLLDFLASSLPQPLIPSTGDRKFTLCSEYNTFKLVQRPCGHRESGI